MNEFSRIKRLPPYVFNITDAMKKSARHRGEDIIDFGMGNPDGATPKHIVDKMIEAALKPSATGTRRATTSISIPRPRPSSRSAPRKASRTSASQSSTRTTRCWCRTLAIQFIFTAR